MTDSSLMTISQIAAFNPVASESLGVRQEYLKLLKKYAVLFADADKSPANAEERKKTVLAMYDVYKQVLESSTCQADFAKRMFLGEDEKRRHYAYMYLEHLNLPGILYYRNFFLMDLFHILGYSFSSKDSKKAMEMYNKQFVMNMPHKYTSVKTFFRLLKHSLSEYNDSFCSKEEQQNKTKKYLAAAKFSYDAQKKYRKGNKASLAAKAMADAFEMCGQTSSKTQGIIALTSLLKGEFLDKMEKDYLQKIIHNLCFMQEKPITILVTGTIKAGKSTFINALAGRYVCKAENLVCTSSAHCIVSKPFDDYMPIIPMHKNLELDTEEPSEDNSYLFFRGQLGGKRIIIKDTPGVNNSLDPSHRKRTVSELKQGLYDILIYVIPSDTLGAEDDFNYLRFIKEIVPEDIVFFIMNKIDNFNLKTEDVIGAINSCISFIESAGFKSPTLCPLSSEAAYFAKCAETQQKMSEDDADDLNIFIKKFKKFNLHSYYEQFNIKNFSAVRTENQELLRNCGLIYAESLILKNIGDIK